MTREIIRQIERDYWAEKADPIDMSEIFDLAQKALEQESNCSEIPTGSTTKNDLGVDCISREQAKEAIRDKFKDLSSRVEINTILNDLPSVTSQEPILDKIRAEIETKYGQCDICEYDAISGWEQVSDIADILQIIDKYKAESEQTDGNDATNAGSN